MHKKVEHLFAQKTQKQEDINKINVLFNVNSRIQIIKSNIVNNFNRYF